MVKLRLASAACVARHCKLGETHKNNDHIRQPNGGGRYVDVIAFFMRALHADCTTYHVTQANAFSHSDEISVSTPLT